MTDFALIIALERLCEAIQRLDNTVHFGDNHAYNGVRTELEEAKYYVQKAKENSMKLINVVQEARK